MDLHNNAEFVTAVQPYDPSATGTKTGIIIDRASYGYGPVTFAHMVGAIAATGFSATPVILAGAATGSLASVADTDLIGTEAGAALSGTAADNKCGKVTYKGTARYVRMDLIVAGAATGFHAGVAVLPGPRKGPRSTQVKP